jgi:hypothetical protein
MTGERRLRGEDGVLDFGALAGRLRTAAAVLGVFAVGGVIVDGLRSGLEFAMMVRWAAAFVLGMVVVAAVLVALHALRGADTAQRRGESLSGPDVGLVPPRRRRE